jgi:hypothetical protein
MLLEMRKRWGILKNETPIPIGVSFFDMFCNLQKIDFA